MLLKPNTYAGVEKVGLQIHKEINVPKGFVYLRTGVYDMRSSTARALGVSLTDAIGPPAK